MYKVNHIAAILGVSTRQIRNYIANGDLIAKKLDGSFHITRHDFDLFLEEYYPTRHKAKGKAAIPTDIELDILKEFVDDILDDDFNYGEFVAKHGKIDRLLPALSHFILLKRNKQIYADRIKYSMTYGQLAEKYSLSVKTIEKILIKKREEEQFQFND